jgi:hypothetical protein
MIRNGLLQLQQARVNRYDIIESTAQNIIIGGMQQWLNRYLN